jgi:hypothetical protein
MTQDLAHLDPRRFGLSSFAELLLERRPVIGEDPGTFAQFHAGLTQSLAPMTPYECVIAENLISIEWELVQRRRVRDATLNRHIRKIIEDAYVKKSLNDFAEWLQERLAARDALEGAQKEEEDDAGSEADHDDDTHARFDDRYDDEYPRTRFDDRYKDEDPYARFEDDDDADADTDDDPAEDCDTDEDCAEDKFDIFEDETPQEALDRNKAKFIAAGQDLAARAMSRDPEAQEQAYQELAEIGLDPIDLMDHAFLAKSAAVEQHERQIESFERRRRDVKRDYDALQKSRAVEAQTIDAQPVDAEFFDPEIFDA